MHDKVNELIARMQKQNSFPAISHSIAEINAKASATSNSSVEELADIILKDFSLTGKLLKSRQFRHVRPVCRDDWYSFPERLSFWGSSR